MLIKRVDATPGERSLDGFGGLSFRFGQSGGTPQPSVLGDFVSAVIAGLDVFSEGFAVDGGMGEVVLLDERLVGFVSSGRSADGKFDEFDTKEAVVFAVDLVELSGMVVRQKSGFLAGRKGRSIALMVGDPDVDGAVITVSPLYGFTASGIERSKDATPLADLFLAAVNESRGVEARWRQVPEGLAVEF